LPIERLLETTKTTPDGLTQEEAEIRLEQYGFNEVAHERNDIWYVELLKAFNNPFIYLLMGLSLLNYFINKDIKATILITTMIFLSGFLRFFQEFRSNQSAKKLKEMVNTTATVTRDGLDKKDIPMKLIVPGDIIFLSAGDMVPADCRIISSKDLFISQSALTGEALPQEKYNTLGEVAGKSSKTGQRKCIDNPFECPALCFMGTNVIGGTASAVVLYTGSHTYFGSLAKNIIGQRSLTSFDKGINGVSWLLIRFILVLVPLVFLINGITKHNWTQSFFFALSVAIGLTPELLPMIVTTNLAKGAIVMSKKKVIVKRLNSIQNFGAMDVLCTDKTGTLTQDKIILEKHLDIYGEDNDEVLRYAFLNSYYQTGLKNLLDRAVLTHFELEEMVAKERNYKKVDEIPFDFVRRRMSVLVEKEENQHIIICKGALEEIISVCSSVRTDEGIVPFSLGIMTTINTVTRELNEDGFRIIAVAYKEIPLSKDEYTVKDESDLTLIGYLAFLDPPKESASEAIQALQKYGVSVKILTGDSDVITCKICREVGIDVKRVVLGNDLDGFSEKELSQVVEEANVFAKLSPVQKSLIIRTLQKNGHAVGFLGDGINDAAALRDADVGISVDTATDIAKESADIILLEKSLLVLEEGAIEGRKTFNNIIKYIKMGTSSNFGNMFSVLGASAWLPFLPMLPMQIITNNLLYDVSQIAIPFDQVDEEYLLQPRRWKIGDISRFTLFIGPISSLFDYATYFLMFFVFRANSPVSQGLFQTGWFIESLISQTIIIHMIRTHKVPFIQSRASMPLIILTSLIIGTAIAITYSPIGKILGFVHLPFTYFIWLFFFLICYMLLTQAVKIFYIKKFKNWL
jgi:Mg2+-importing ATPase